MTWTPITPEEVRTGRQVALWIKTARAGYTSFGREWYPTGADFHKSALLERIRSGKAPLKEPPPLGMSCPWYALVEDQGPHYVFDVHLHNEIIHPDNMRDHIFVLQSPYTIIEKRSDTEFIVRDGYHKDTSYRFRLWYDPEWTHPNTHYGKGGWFMQNMEFATTRTTVE
jgi:hypothetical protein